MCLTINPASASEQYSHLNFCHVTDFQVSCWTGTMSHAINVFNVYIFSSASGKYSDIYMYIYLSLSLSVCVYYSTRQTQTAVGVDAEVEPVIIRHPDCSKAEAILRNAWADAKLVAD